MSRRPGWPTRGWPREAEGQGGCPHPGLSLAAPEAGVGGAWGGVMHRKELDLESYFCLGQVFCGWPCLNLTGPQCRRGRVWLGSLGNTSLKEKYS